MELVCGVCGFPMEPDEQHFHIPDFYLEVWNLRARLMRARVSPNGTVRTEPVPWEIPDHWVQWILDTCGGAINLSGQYTLPGLIREWCWAKGRNDEISVRAIEKKIEALIGKREDDDG